MAFYRSGRFNICLENIWKHWPTLQCFYPIVFTTYCLLRYSIFPFCFSISSVDSMNQNLKNEKLARGIKDTYQELSPELCVPGRHWFKSYLLGDSISCYLYRMITYGTIFKRWHNKADTEISNLMLSIVDSMTDKPTRKRFLIQSSNDRMFYVSAW